MPKVNVYNQKGEREKEYALPDSVFGLQWNADLVHQVIVGMRANARQGTAHTKTRGEIRGGGRKPWRQKGTGRARHGSRRSPIWVGGGVTHGPRTEKDHTQKINKKQKKKALFIILSKKAKEGELVLLDKLLLPEMKTRAAREVLTRLSQIKGYEKMSYITGKRVLILNPDKSDTLMKSFRNIKSVSVEETRNLNPLDAITYKYVILVDPEKSVNALARSSGKK